MAGPNKTVDQNILPVQALFNLDNSFNTFIGQGQPFYASVNPVQSGLTITNSTINSSVIGGSVPAAATFTSMATTTGTVSTTPVGNTDIANKLYVDATAAGLSWKQPVLCATTANITLSGLQTIDTISVTAGSRVLVKNQSTQANNGIYIASSGAWTYASDANTYNQYVSAICFVESGTQAGSAWYCYVQPGGTLGTTPITWSQFSTSATYTAGTGLTLSAFQFSITNTGVTANSYGSASSVPTYTVNAQGQLTAASNTAISIAPSQINATIPNSGLTNSSVTFNGVSVSLGGSGTITAQTPNALTIGTGLSGGSFNGSSAVTIANTGVLSFSAGTTGFTPNTATTGAVTLGGTLNVANGGTGATTLTGYVYGNGTGAFTASTTIPSSSITGLGTMATQNANSVAITGGTLSSVTSTGETLNNPSISNYATFTAVSAPTYTAGRLWYDTNQNALAYYNDVTNNTLHIGEEIQLKVYNNTGSTINIGQPVYVTSTSSGYTYPNVALAIANSLTTGNVIGLANQNIPTGTAGYVTTIGLVQGLNTGSYTVGDTLYLSPYSAGYFQNTIPPTGYAIKLGTVAYVNSSTGAIYVNKSILSVQAGNIVGQVGLSNGGTGANLTAVAGGVVYSGASALAISAAGTTGQVLTSNGSGAPTWSTPTAYATVTDDTTTNATRYPLFAAATSGNLSTEYTSSTKYQFNPFTGTLTATVFSGSGASLTSIPNSALNNSSITVGTTAISLGASSTTLAGLTSVTSTTFVGALTGNASTATTATTATNATNVAITDNTSSSSTWYPILSAASTGNNPATTSSTKLSFLPSTGTLTATVFSGSLAASNITGALGVANGGTGLTSYTAGDLPYYSSGSALSKLGIGTSGYVLESNGSAPTWVAQSTLSVGTATNATNIAITDNTSSSATWYPTIVSATTGNLPQTTSSTKFSFVPSTGVLSITGANLSGLTASSAVATDSSKNLVSVTNTGTGNNVLSASPTLTGTANFAGITATGTTKSSVFNTDTGSASVPNATWTTVYTFANIGASQCYLVTVNIGSTGLAGSFGVMGIVTIDNGSSNLLTSFAPGGQLIRMSGLSLQTYQVSGATQTGYAYTVRIA